MASTTASYAGARLLEILSAHADPNAAPKALPTRSARRSWNLKMREGEPPNWYADCAMRRLRRPPCFADAREVITHQTA